VLALLFDKRVYCPGSTYTKLERVFSPHTCVYCTSVAIWWVVCWCAQSSNRRRAAEKKLVLRVPNFDKSSERKQNVLWRWLDGLHALTAEISEHSTGVCMCVYVCVRMCACACVCACASGTCVCVLLVRAKVRQSLRGSEGRAGEQADRQRQRHRAHIGSGVKCLSTAHSIPHVLVIVGRRQPCQLGHSSVLTLSVVSFFGRCRILWLPLLSSSASADVLHVERSSVVVDAGYSSLASHASPNRINRIASLRSSSSTSPSTSSAAVSSGAPSKPATKAITTVDYPDAAEVRVYNGAGQVRIWSCCGWGNLPRALELARRPSTR
jgi:hypothetical protein